MTEKQFVNRKWSPFEVVIYQPTNKHTPIECIVITVNFEDEIVELRPLMPKNYQSGFYDKFWTQIRFIKTPRMKVMT